MERVEIQQLRQLDINARASGEFRVVDSKTAECSTRRTFRNARGKNNDAVSNAKKNDQLDGVVDAFLFRGGAASAHFVDVLCSYDGFQHADTVAWIAARYLTARRPSASFRATSIQSSYLSQSPVSALVTALCASLAYMFPASAVPTCAMITAPQAPTRFYCTVGEVSLVLHHWVAILGLQHGAPAALYERFFDRLLELMSTGHAASHAALCCSSAKGLAFLWLAVHHKRRTSDSGQFTVAAASALNVPLRKLETFAVTLREDLGMQEEFFTWAIRRWLHVVESHVNLFAASVAVDEGRGPQAVSQTFVISVVPDQHHRHSHSSEPLTSPQFKNTALFSELLAPSAVDSLQSMLWGDMSDNDHQHETNAGRVWALLHAMRRHHCSAATPSSRVILIGLRVSDRAVSWIFPHKCVPWAAPMLPREFTKLAECAAIMSVAQTKDSRTGINEMDDDEMGPFSFSQDRFFQPWMLLSSSTVTKKASRHYFDYAQMSPASKVRVLLMGLGVRYLETSAAPGASPHDSVAGGASAAADELDVVVDGRTSVVTWLNPEVLSFVHTAADTTKSLILAPTIQAAARAYLSAHHFVARKHRSRMRHHVVIVQGFIRALSSMRHTCHKDVFQRIASMSFADSLSATSTDDVGLHRSQLLDSSWNGLNLSTSRSLEMGGDFHYYSSRRALPQRAPMYRQRLIGLESLEHRARCLVSEEHHRVWQSMTTGMFLRSPLWGLMYRQRIHRDLLTDSEIMHRAQYVALEETALRDRLQVIEGRALSKVLIKTLIVRQESIAFTEQRSRAALAELCFAESQDLIDGFNVMKQLHHLSELRTGASLRQVLDREREYMEAPFQNRELFHTMTAASVNYHHNSRGKYDNNNNTLTALAAIAPASATVSAADAIFADAMAQSSTVLTPHYARQRQRFLTSVLENLGAILTAERHDRAMLITHQVLAYCRSLEASERSALSKQHQFHLVKYRMQFQRTHLEVLERHHRLPIYQTSAEIRDELHDRCSLEFQELRLRLVLKQLMGHQTSLLQKSAEDWNAVSADRYRSPGMLLAELQKEQRQVQQLLSSLHVAEARQQAQRKDALRKSGGGGGRQSPTAPIAVLQTTIARNAPLAAQQLVKGLPATNPRKALVNGVPMNTSHRSDSQDRRNIRGTIL